MRNIHKFLEMSISDKARYKEIYILYAEHSNPVTAQALTEYKEIFGNDNGSNVATYRELCQLGVNKYEKNTINHG